MTRNERAWQAYNGARRELRRNGIDPDRWIGQAHAYATGIMAYNGFGEPARPDITSGRRSPQRQRELIEMWDAGQRQGFIGAPARCSKHTVGAAIDVETNVQGFQIYRYLMRQFGLRDGAAFDDLGHFDEPNVNGYCV